MSPKTKFFDKRTKQSEIKTRIVSKFFASWANVLGQDAINQGRPVRLGYVDIYSGPGRYKDGSPSTPLKILEHAVATPMIADGLICQFNDEDPNFAAALGKEIDAFPGLYNLRTRPSVSSVQVCDAVVSKLTELGRQRPTLYFFDPWGYKGLTLKLIEEAIMPFGCDCIFFFNVKRINAAIRNKTFAPHVNALFGNDRANVLRAEWEVALKHERAGLILRHLKDALESVGGKYNREYRVSNDQGKVSHFLIMTSKHPLAYKIMKDIMAGESAITEEGVPTFDHHPSGSLFADATIRELEQELLRDFARQTVQFGRLFEKHHVGRDFTAPNYREAIRRLEQNGTITVVPDMKQRARAGIITCGPKTKISFP